MAHSLRRRLTGALSDPWVLLTTAVGGGMAWAAGIPVLGAAGICAGMLGGAVAVASVLRDPGEEDEPRPSLEPGTRQERLVGTLDGYLSDLAELRASKLPASIQDSAIEALVATGGARDQALRVAVAVDKLDGAIQRSEGVAAGHGDAPPVGAWESIERMRARRNEMLGKLDSAVGDVAEAYTKLLELSATVDTLDLGGPQVTDIDQVNASLDQLRTAFDTLAKDAGSPS